MLPSRLRQVLSILKAPLRFKKDDVVSAPVKKVKPVKAAKPTPVVNKGNPRKIAGWLPGHILSDLPNLPPEHQQIIQEEFQKRVATVPTSPKSGKHTAQTDWGSVVKDPRFHGGFNENTSAEGDIVRQLTTEYAFSPKKVREALDKGKSIVPQLSNVKRIPGNTNKRIGQQKTFGDSPQEYTAPGYKVDRQNPTHGWHAGAGVFTLHGRQYAPGQPIPQTEMKKWSQADPDGFQQRLNRPDHLPGALTQDREVAQEYANSKLKGTPKGKTANARLFSVSPEANGKFQDPYARIPQATLPQNARKVVQSNNPSALTKGNGFTLQSFKQSLGPALVAEMGDNHPAFRFFKNADMVLTWKAIQNGLSAYNNTRHPELLAGSAAIGLVKRNWYKDSSKFFHAMFNLHGETPFKSKSNSSDALAKRVQAEYQQWAASGQKGAQSDFLRNGLDCARFASVVAATSPGVSVKSNMVLALHIWDAWERYKEETGKSGNPLRYADFVQWTKQNHAHIINLDIVKEESGGNAKKVDIRLHNKLLEKSTMASIQASLFGDGAAVLGLTKQFLFKGPKTEAFRLACFGLPEGVKDVWESYRDNVPQGNFSSSQGVVADPHLVTDASYMGAGSTLQVTADVLNRHEKQYPDGYDKPWTVSDVQAAGWCGLKGIIEYAMFRTMSPEKALKSMTVADMNRVEEFTPIVRDFINAHPDNKDAILAGFISNARSRRTGGQNPSGANRDKAHNDLQRIVKLLTAHQVDPGTKIWDLIPQQLKPLAEEFAARSAVHLGSGSTKSFLEMSEKSLRAMGIARPPKKIKKFKHGLVLKFAQFIPTGGGMSQPTAPTAKPNVGFGNAVAKSGTGKNVAQAQLNDQISAKAGIRTMSHTGIGDWPDGSEQSTVHLARQQVDPKTFEYLGALHGIAGQKKSMLVFHPNAKGPDSLYRINHPETDQGKLRHSLNSSGISYKTLIPGPKGTQVLMFDPGRARRESVGAFATQNGVIVEESTGQGRIIGHNGSWNSAGALPKSRQVFRDIISAHEGKPIQSSATSGPDATPANSGKLSKSGAKASRRPAKTTKVVRFSNMHPKTRALIASSPNVGEDLPFDRSMQNYRGAQNHSHLQIAAELFKSFNLTPKSHLAIGDWEDGSEHSVIHHFPTAIPTQLLHYFAAKIGYQADQKAVLAFGHHDQGPDAVYHVHIPHNNVEYIRESLHGYGFNNRTIVPHRDRTEVVLYDQDALKRAAANDFAANNNARIFETRGTGKFVGAPWGSDPKNARILAKVDYNARIKPFESRYHSAASQPGIPDNPGAPLPNRTRQQRSGRPLHLNRSRRVLEGFLRAHNTPNKELPPIGDLLAPDLQSIKPEHLSKYQELIPGAKWGEIQGAVDSLQSDPSLYEDMTSESNRRDLYQREHARGVLNSSGVHKLLDSLVVNRLIPDYATHLVQDAKDGNFHALEAISTELQHSIPSLKAYVKSAEREFNKAGKAWDKMRSGVQRYGKQHHSQSQDRAGPHGVLNNGFYPRGCFVPGTPKTKDGKARFEKGSNNFNAFLKNIRNK